VTAVAVDSVEYFAVIVAIAIETVAFELLLQLLVLPVLQPFLPHLLLVLLCLLLPLH